MRHSTKGWKWRAIGVVAGFYSLSLAGGEIGERVGEKDGAAVYIGGMLGAVAGIAAGYVIGNLADRHTTVIVIVP